MQTTQLIKRFLQKDLFKPNFCCIAAKLTGFYVNFDKEEFMRSNQMGRLKLVDKFVYIPW